MSLLRQKANQMIKESLEAVMPDRAVEKPWKISRAAVVGQFWWQPERLPGRWQRQQCVFWDMWMTEL